MVRRPLVRAALVVGAVLVPVSISAIAEAQSTLPAVDVIEVEGALDRPLLGYVNGMLDDAEARGATVLLEVNSAGGIGDEAIGLADRLVAMRVPVLVWLGPVPAKASGAGMLLLLASSLPAVAPGSQTGPLDPVDLLHPAARPPGLDARIDAWLAARGRTVDRAHENEAMNGAQAIGYGYAAVAAPSVVDLLDQVDGTSVPTASGEVTLHTHVATTEADAQAGHGGSIR